MNIFSALMPRTMMASPMVMVTAPIATSRIFRFLSKRRKLRPTRIVDMTKIRRNNPPGNTIKEKTTSTTENKDKTIWMMKRAIFFTRK